MSSLSPPHSMVPRRRSRNENGDDSDASDSVNATPASNSKRPRLNPTEDESESEGDESEENEDTQNDADGSRESSQPTAPRPKAHLGIGPGGYKPGAIVRIKVANFVTYTSAEFHPGPKLNMVIGPNGTGKSTLVCAICLGLGWGPQHLGRAKDLGEFVKHGCAEAKIEIELAGQPKLPSNPVICRTIKRDGNKSSFTINGKNASSKQVLKFVQSFAIQVDNLCQFLPQDKVAEFAALSPVELLHSTQRAAAEPEMTAWHDHLKGLRQEQKQLELENRGDNETLANLRGRQEQQRAEVENMRQLAVAQEKLQLLELSRPLIEYREFRKQFDALRARKAQVELEEQQLKAELEPALQAVAAKKSYVEQIGSVRQHRRERAKKLSDAASRFENKLNNLQKSMDDLDDQIAVEKKSSQKHKSEATQAQQKVNRLKRSLEEDASDFDAAYYNDQLREKRLEQRELQTKATGIKQERIPVEEKRKELESHIEEAETQLRSLDSQMGQQEARLQQVSSETFKAYRWVKTNQDKFEKPVIGPPIVTCSITDPKYADAIETLLNKNDCLAFTVQTKKDFRTLQQHLMGQMKLHDITIKTSPSRDYPPPPVSDQELRQLGFDGWAKDFISGPDPVIATLCMENRFSQTPIGLSQFRGEQAEVDELRRKKIAIFVAGSQMYQTNYRAEYNASSTSIKMVGTAKFWTSQPIDTSIKQTLLQNIRNWKGEKTEVEQQIQAFRKELENLGNSHNEIDRTIRKIEADKAAKQSAHTEWLAIPQKISQEESKVKSLQELFAGVREKVAGYRDEQDGLAIQKAEAALEYADAAEALRHACEELIKAEVWYLEATSDHTTLEDEHSHYTRMLAQKAQEVKRLGEEYRERNARGKTMLQRARKIKQDLDQRPNGEEVRDMINEATYSLDDLNADIDSVQAQIRLFVGGNSNIIKIFEDREKQIERLETKLSDFRTKLAGFDAAIKEVQGRWEPRLDALIAKISDAFGDSFARIGCAGQVSLDKVEAEPGPNGEPGGTEFDQWSIQIHVKFREHEQLSILDSHRQSGGERAVSTIFYLMALQSLSASPFRVVDEINQGMDPRNERMVHGRLVDIACDSDGEGATDENGNPVGGGGGGQYFLITPKLLSGLSYKPGMRVLCIYSGEHMPEEYAKLDFGRAVRKMRAINEQAKSRAGGNNSQVDVYG
ncbi:structural maintenance of chromosomes protein 5 [Penicillium ochrochloron]